MITNDIMLNVPQNRSRDGRLPKPLNEDLRSLVFYYNNKGFIFFLVVNFLMFGGLLVHYLIFNTIAVTDIILLVNPAMAIVVLGIYLFFRNERAYFFSFYAIVIFSQVCYVINSVYLKNSSDYAVIATRLIYLNLHICFICLIIKIDTNYVEVFIVFLINVLLLVPIVTLGILTHLPISNFILELIIWLKCLFIQIYFKYAQFNMLAKLDQVCEDNKEVTAQLHSLINFMDSPVICINLANLNFKANNSFETTYKNHEKKMSNNNLISDLKGVEPTQTDHNLIDKTEVNGEHNNLFATHNSEDGKYRNAAIDFLKLYCNFSKNLDENDNDFKIILELFMFFTKILKLGEKRFMLMNAEVDNLYDVLIYLIKNGDCFNTFRQTGLFVFDDIVYDIFIRKPNCWAVEIIFRDSTKISNIEKEIEENKTKAMYLAKTAHEFKTPLIALMSCVERTMLSQNISSKVQKKSIEDIMNLSNYMISLIQDINDYSKISSAGEFDCLIEEFDLRSTINFVFSVLLTLINCNDNKKKNITPLLNIAQDVPMRIKSDEKRLKQVLLNLLSNSFKFTNKGSISLKVEMEKINNNDKKDAKYYYSQRRKCIKFTIEDTGIGIQQENKSKLFKEYGKIISNETDKVNKEGTGLGLNISKKIISILGDEINFESIPHQNTKFWFCVFDKDQKIEEKINKKSSFGSTTNYEDLDMSNVSEPLDQFTITKKLLNKQIPKKKAVSQIFVGEKDLKFIESRKILNSFKQTSTPKTNKKTNSINIIQEDDFTLLKKSTEYKFNPMKSKSKFITNKETLNIESSPCLKPLDVVVRDDQIDNFSNHENDTINNNNDVAIVIIGNSTIEEKSFIKYNDIDLLDKTIKSNSSHNQLSRHRSSSSCVTLNVANQQIIVNNYNEIHSTIYNNAAKKTEKIKDNLQITCNQFSLPCKNNRFLKNFNKFIKNTNKKVIIIVDDSDLIRKSFKRLIKEHLSTKGIANIFELIDLSDGFDLMYLVYLDQIHGKKIKYIFTDDSMDFLDGSDAIKIMNLNKNLDTSYFDLIMVTSFVQESYNNEITQILSKPIDRKTIQKIIKV